MGAQVRGRSGCFLGHGKPHTWNSSPLWCTHRKIWGRLRGLIKVRERLLADVKVTWLNEKVKVKDSKTLVVWRGDDSEALNAAMIWNLLDCLEIWPDLVQCSSTWDYIPVPQSRISIGCWGVGSAEVSAWAEWSLVRLGMWIAEFSLADKWACIYFGKRYPKDEVFIEGMPAWEAEGENPRQRDLVWWICTVHSP